MSEFERAKEEVTQLSKSPDNLMKLRLYALFKQSTEGDVKGDRPGALNMVGRAKYDAWDALKGTSQEEAKQQYIALVEELKEMDKRGEL